MRPVTPADLGAIHELHQRIERHDGVPLVTTREEIDDWLTEPHFDLAKDARIVEADGEPVAWGRIWYQPSGVREERVFVLGAVAPERRRHGIGSRLLAWQIERATEVLRRSTGELPKFVRAHGYDTETAAFRLYERHGMSAVRYGEQLLRDLESLPDTPSIDGIAIVGWDPARSESARVVLNEAFADHWGSAARDPRDWEHSLESHGMRLDLSFLALDDDQVVGVSLNGCYPGDEALLGRREGWIQRIGVVRSHRKRGIASALISASLAAFRRVGLTHSALSVDSANPSGANRLYERIGYRPTSRTVTYQLEV